MAFHFQRRTKSKTKVCQQSLLETIKQESSIPKADDFNTTFGLNDSFVRFDKPKKRNSGIIGPYMEIKNKEIRTDGSYSKMLIEFWRLLDEQQALPEYRYFKRDRSNTKAWYNDDIIVSILQFCRKMLALDSTIVVDPSSLESFDTWDEEVKTPNNGIVRSGDETPKGIVDVSDETDSEPVGGGKTLNTDELMRKYKRIFTKADDKNPKKTTQVLVPYNLNKNHWLLLHYHVARGEVLCDVYDSMYEASADRNRFLSHIKGDRISLLADALAASIWKEHFKKGQPNHEVNLVQFKFPQQDDESCGVYACLAGAMIMSGMLKDKIMQIPTNIELIRKCRVFFFKLLASQPWLPQLDKDPFYSPSTWSQSSVPIVVQPPKKQPPAPPKKQPTAPPATTLALGGTRKKSKPKSYAKTNRKRSVHRRLRLRRLP